MTASSLAGIRIRDATSADLDACARIFAAGQQEILPDAPVPWTPAGFAAAVDGEHLIVATAGDGDIAGFLSLFRPEHFVHFLHVRNGRRGLGIGRLLLAHARHGATGPLELKCLLSNTRALAFYRRLGWIEIEHEPAAAWPFVRLRQPS